MPTLLSAAFIAVRASEGDAAGVHQRFDLGHGHGAGVGVAADPAIAATTPAAVDLGLLDRGQRLHDRLGLLQLRQRRALVLLHLLQQRLLGGEFLAGLGLLPVQQLLLGLDVGEDRFLTGVQLALERGLLEKAGRIGGEHHLHRGVHLAGAVLGGRLGAQGRLLLVDRALLAGYLVLEHRDPALQRLLLALRVVVLLSCRVRRRPVGRHVLGRLAEGQLGRRLSTGLRGERHSGGSRRGEHRHAGAIGLLGAAM
ncbi:hypothetical protein GXW82_23005 [Streptacidiphilus sp. 4-A2]|nr:hypothetical protein [Streptacidiphilus sp. 4-A2]